MNKLKKVSLVFFFSAFILSCQAQDTNSVLLKPEAFQTLLNDNPDVQLIDVRTTNEFNSGYIKNARNIDISSAEFHSALSKLDKTKPIAVYCAAGGRSGRAASQLQKMGFESIYDLNGGMGAWQKAELPISK